MQPLANPIAFATAFATQEAAHHATVVPFLAREATAPAEVRRLDDGNIAECDAHEPSFALANRHAIEGGFVRVECDGRHGLVRLGRLFAYHDDYSSRCDRKRTEPPTLILANIAMPCRKREVQLHALRAVNRDPQAPGIPVEAIRLVLRFQHQLPQVWHACPFSSAHPLATAIESTELYLHGAREVLLGASVSASTRTAGSPPRG